MSGIRGSLQLPNCRLKQRHSTLLHYIDNQEEHHQTQTFQDEYRTYLKKYGVEFDERYLWD